MIRIAGMEVKVGDKLYNIQSQRWVKVLGEESNSLIAEMTNSRGDKREIRITEGGYVLGRRAIYWHVPITLDLPVADVSKVQQLVDFAVNNLGLIRLG